MAAQLTAVGRFSDRSCLVAGGARGIGRALAFALADEGARVGILARTESDCRTTAAEIGEDRAVALQGDVTDPAACAKAVAELNERFGTMSILVNAAAISPVRTRIEDHQPASFAEILHVNASGAQTLARAAAPSLFARRGAVLNVASVLGVMSSPRLAAYGASKAALIHFTRTLAREWADRGVRVNTICPGYVETDLTRAMLAVDRIRTEIVAQTPLGRIASMPEIVAPALFLLSDDASYITGSALVADGGMAA